MALPGLHHHFPRRQSKLNDNQVPLYASPSSGGLPCTPTFGVSPSSLCSPQFCSTSSPTNSPNNTTSRRPAPLSKKLRSIQASMAAAGLPLSLQQMAMDGARPGPWLPRYIFDDDASEATVEMPSLPEALTDNAPTVKFSSLADAVFEQTTVPTLNKELKTKTRIGIPDQDWHPRPGLASPTRIPPSNSRQYTIQNPPTKSRQLNSWLATLSESDFIEAMNTISFSEQCHPFRAATNRFTPLIKWRRSTSSTHHPTMSSSAARVDPQGTTPGTLAAASSDAISPRSSRVAPVTPEVYALQKSSGQFSEKSSGLPLEKSSGLPLEKSSGLLSEKCSGAYFTEFSNNTLLSPPAVVGSACNFLGPSSCSSSVELFNNIGHGGGRQAEVT